MIQHKKPNILSISAATSLYSGCAAGFLMLLFSVIVSYFNIQSLNQTAQRIADTHQILLTLDEVLSLTKDAETGQRGFILTGNEKYLDPYTSATINLESTIQELDRLIQESPDQRERIPPLKAAITFKMDELAQTINLRRNQGFEAALEVVMTDRGKAAMDEIRTIVKTMHESERDRRVRRISAMETAYGVAVISSLLTGLMGAVLVAIVAVLMRRATLARQMQNWLQSGEIGLSNEW